MRERVRHPRALSRETITAAARRIADTEGIAELTLRRVATELGTGQASLYRHIADRAELLVLLADDLAADFPTLDTGPAPDRAIVRQWVAMHDYLAAHPWGARLIAEGEHLASGTRHVVEHNIALLERAGLDGEDATRAYRALWHLLLGHLLNDHPLGHGDAFLQDGRAEHTAGEETDFTWALRRLLDGILIASTGAAHER